MPGVLNRRNMLALLGAAATWSALADDGSLADLNHIRMISGITAGSTADRILRAFSAAAQRLLPGARIDTENGTGSLRTLGTVAAAGPDPTILAMIGGSVLYDILQDTEDASTRFNTINFIGSIGRDRAALYATRQSGITSLEALHGATVPLFVPVSSVKTATYVNALLINALTGTRLQPVPGYPSATRKIAILSGEVNIAVGSTDSFSDLVDQGVLVPLMRLRDVPFEPPYTNLPALPQLARGPDAATLLGLMAAVMGYDRILISQPSALPALVDALRQLFAKAIGDAQFIADSGMGADLDANDHLAVEDNVGKILAQRATLGPTLAKALACGLTLGSGGACG